MLLHGSNNRRMFSAIVVFCLIHTAIRCMAQGPSRDATFYSQASNRVDVLLKIQHDDGTWSTNSSRTYSTAICALALLSHLEGAENDAPQRNLLHLRILKALDHLRLATQKDGASSAAYMRALALYYGWDILGSENLKTAAETAIQSLEEPNEVRGQLIATMLFLSSAGHEYARVHGILLDRQDVVQKFNYIDRTLPAPLDAAIRFHLRTMIYWSISRTRPLTNVLPECWQAMTRYNDASREPSTHIEEDALLIITANTYRFRKIGPGAGMYRSLSVDSSNKPPRSLDEDSSAFGIKISP